MQLKAFLWLASLPLLAILLASPQPRHSNPKSIPAQALLQELTSTLKPTAAPARQNTRSPRPTPTPARVLPVQHNPGLIVGAIIVVAIILFGVFRFTRK